MARILDTTAASRRSELEDIGGHMSDHEDHEDHEEHEEPGAPGAPGECTCGDVRLKDCVCRVSADIREQRAMLDELVKTEWGLEACARIVGRCIDNDIRDGYDEDYWPMDTAEMVRAIISEPRLPDVVAALVTQWVVGIGDMEGRLAFLREHFGPELDEGMRRRQLQQAMWDAKWTAKMAGIPEDDRPRSVEEIRAMVRKELEREGASEGHDPGLVS